MVIVRENGAQRAATLTLKAPCTIQEILNWLNIPFQKNTEIQVIEVNSSGIDYVVALGKMAYLK